MANITNFLSCYWTKYK